MLNTECNLRRFHALAFIALPALHLYYGYHIDHTRENEPECC